jgi:hypothetical protein
VDRTAGGGGNDTLRTTMELTSIDMQAVRKGQIARPNWVLDLPWAQSVAEASDFVPHRIEVTGAIFTSISRTAASRAAGLRAALWLPLPLEANVKGRHSCLCRRFHEVLRR